ncbi:stage V sporulation protein AD [Paenibacillus larvae subsp. larvae]|uniref:Stage V sporulation protein AD n=2 Tax=Paenibacillus larvae TaxID=1464 RepID=A0A1V0UPR6_9BACL|nr:stage V sporulation protein AD [Paenibacillus larvae]AQT83964.1 stage V sporulation protein AD [Paenibacillus larvae subsp. pulvifaciens]AQZ45417.1 stage V sporulation protein AD [Paenibacillus larvae subsp. pulvifaciens]ARF67285.1 stage V sporulation protein AD [Paenibacillus larvae subsp. pulvifaciens]AVF27377.1 stage V sporulation protein AD [Paenibacillus larvae subsp. larvae]AVF32040.1 stage V sporulation protein AD [Paenibacillus larvae subsp. larvae]
MLKGHQSWLFENKPVILSTATVVGPEEGAGPLARDFDVIHEDMTLGQTSWEKAEKKLMEEAANLAIKKSGVNKGSIQFYLGGDLLNQIISNSFAARTLAIPYIGIFGACSTSMEGLALASLIVNAGAADHAMCGTCSHNCTVEKQFRYPTEYGSQKPPTAQYTVTGAGAAIVGRTGEGPVVTGATIGKVMDMGITDPFNMGAAMSPAAADTLQAHFRDFQREPGYYDLIVTGDLAAVGYDITKGLLKKHKVPMEQTTFKDCGLMVFDREKQGVQAGGSGCGCSAVVTYGHIMKQLKEGKLRRVLVVATGALLSPLSYQQGESIPCIAHAVAIENERS